MNPTLHILFLCGFLWGLNPALSAQEPLVFKQTTVDFGAVESWKNPPAVFAFTNESLDGQFILSPRSGRNVLVEIPRTRIESGESGQVLVYFYTENTGKFNEEIELYASGSTNPIKLTIKGNIKSLAQDALTACPDFSQTKRVERPEGPWSGKVIDAITKAPITNAKVDFPGAASVYSDRRGRFQLSLPLGMFQVRVEALGYQSLSQMQAIARNQADLLYELYPLGADTNLTTNQVDSIPAEDEGDFSLREFRPNNLVLLYDISGSMKRDDRIGQLKNASKQLIALLRRVDYVSLLVFARKASASFLQQPGDQKASMNEAIEALEAKGTTDGGAGLEEAYRTAKMQFIEGGNNQVILATDGRFEVNEGLRNFIQAQKNQGIALTIIGFGTKDSQGIQTLQELAALGGGGFLLFQPGKDNQFQLTELIRLRSKR